MRRHSISSFTQQKAAAAAPAPAAETEATEEGLSGKSMVVAVRIRPLSGKEMESGQKSCVSVVNGQTIAIKRFGDPAGYLKSQQTAISEYSFDAVFDDQASQMQVYQATAKPFIPNLLAGLNVTVFAYGATGAGKTHTMLGDTRADQFSSRCEGGIIPNTVSDLFAQIESKREGAAHGETWTVTVTFVEIYNEQVYDLLEPTGKVLQLREDQDKGIVVVAGVTEQVAGNARAVMEMLTRGNQNRKTEATMANQVSSRSHAVLQLSLRHCRRNESGRESAVESKLSLIDLAGSERASATNNRGVRLIEGANINKSLLALANCINALATNATNTGAGAKRTNVKYRDSRLTHLLKASLEGGNCNLIMIANINPSDQTYEDSHNTLKYANRAKNIKVDPRANAVAVESTWVQREARLREENALLRKRVAELEALVGGLRHQLAGTGAGDGAGAGLGVGLLLEGAGGDAEAEGEAEPASFAIESESVIEDGEGSAGLIEPEAEAEPEPEAEADDAEYDGELFVPPSHAHAQAAEDQSAPASGSRKRQRDAADSETEADAEAEAEAEAEANQLAALSDSILAAGLDADAEAEAEAEAESSATLVVMELDGADEAETEAAAAVEAPEPQPVASEPEPEALAEAAPVNRKRRGSLLPQPKARGVTAAAAAAAPVREEAPAPAPAPLPLAPVQPAAAIPSDRRTRRNTLSVPPSHAHANDENANPQLQLQFQQQQGKKAALTFAGPSTGTGSGTGTGALGRRKSLEKVSALLDSSFLTQCSEPASAPAQAQASAAAASQSRVTRSAASASSLPQAQAQAQAQTQAQAQGGARKRRSLGASNGPVPAEGGWLPPAGQVFIDI